MREHKNLDFKNSNEQTVTDEPLDKDWTTRFFRIAEDVSSEEMQLLWGKILAGEIKQPKSYSLRTLEIIRNLSKGEADTFMKVANFAIRSGRSFFLFKTADANFLKDKYGIEYFETASLIEAGLIQPSDLVSYQLYQHPEDSERSFTSGNIILTVKVKANTPTITMPVHVFSNAGSELLKLITSNPPLEYLKQIANSITSENVEVKYGYILAWEDESVKHTPMQDF